MVDMLQAFSVAQLLGLRVRCSQQRCERIKEPLPPPLSHSARLFAGQLRQESLPLAPLGDVLRDEREESSKEDSTERDDSGDDFWLHRKLWQPNAELSRERPAQ